MGRNAKTTPAWEAVVYISALVSNKKYRQGSNRLITNSSQRSLRASLCPPAYFQKARKNRLPSSSRRKISKKGDMPSSAILIAMNALPHSAMAPVRQAKTNSPDSLCIRGLHQRVFSQGQALARGREHRQSRGCDWQSSGSADPERSLLPARAGRLSAEVLR
ncbi:hypothetical protein D3C81_1407350 [compost metagenome]